MILLDSLHINNGGGLVLLKYLINVLEAEKIKVFYLFDERVKNEFDFIAADKKKFMQSTYLSRLKFYTSNKKKFSKIFCFGNLPPYVKTTAKVYTYFHQALFLDIPTEINFKQKIFLKLKQFVFTSNIKNSDYWIVQTDLMKSKLIKKLNKEAIVYTYPFYEPINIVDEPILKKKNSFVYVSNASKHKNHELLVQSFCDFYDKQKYGELTVTVGKEFTELCKVIEEKKKQNYPIDNKGLISKDEVYKLYQENEFLIFPSLSESFGLPIIEAIELGCKVIGSDLPYIYEVCNPTLTFDPNNQKSITDIMIKASISELEESEVLARNEIDKILKIFKDD